MGVAAKAPSDTASRERFALTPAVLGIDLSRSAVPTHSSPAVVSTEPALRLANPHAGGNMKSRTFDGRFGLFIIPLAALVVYMVTSAGPAYATFPGTNGRIAFTRQITTDIAGVFTAKPDGVGRTASAARGNRWSG